MSVLKLTDAKTHLNMTQAVNDGELQGMIDAAEDAIAKKVGPLEQVTVTKRISGGSALVLPVLPAVSLTSITPSLPLAGPDVSLADVYLDADAGVVMHVWSGFPSLAYDVVYTAGRTDCPDDLLLAVKELVRHMWDSQRGGAKRPGAQQSDALSNTLPGSAYTFPIRVTELIAPHLRLGFA